MDCLEGVVLLTTGQTSLFARHITNPSTTVPLAESQCNCTWTLWIRSLTVLFWCLKSSEILSCLFVSQFRNCNDHVCSSYIWEIVHHHNLLTVLKFVAWNHVFHPYYWTYCVINYLTVKLILSSFACNVWVRGKHNSYMQSNALWAFVYGRTLGKYTGDCKRR